MNQNIRNQFLETALLAAKSASELIHKSSQRFVKAYKSKTDLVTETDLASEELISKIIKKNHIIQSVKFYI